MSDSPGGAGPSGGRAGGAVAVAAPLVGLAMLLVVLVGGGAGAQPLPAGCGSGGTAASFGKLTLTAEQMANAELIIATTAGRGLPPYAAIIAVAASWTEASLINDLRQLDHDSEGLFQLRVSLWTKQVADDPVASTSWFLDRLVQLPNWQTIALTDAAADVERPAQAYRGRYATAQPLATAVVSLLWPAASTRPAQTHTAPTGPAPPAVAALPPVGPDGVTTVDPAALCPGGGGGIPVAGGGPASTTIPAGLQVLGSPAGITAANFALSQLGKPYVWGAAGPASYDCSGLTMAAWAAAGVALPHFTGDQVVTGTPSPVDLSAAAAGDLVFITGSDGTATIPGHEGMVAGFLTEPDGRHLLIVQAPHTGVPVQLVDAGRWAGLIVAVRHIG